MTNKQNLNQPFRLDRLFSSEIGRWLMALAVSAVTLGVVFCFVHPVFMTIDDARLKYVYAGYSSGTPVASYLFSYYPLSLVLSKLYTWFPQMHWYGLYQFGVIGLSGALIGKTIYKIAWRKDIRPFWAVLLHLWVYLTTALISTIIMHFEITAAMAGTAGVVLLLGLDVEQDKPVWKITDLIFSIAGIAASFVIQFNAFYAACCYVLVVLVYLLLRGIQQDNCKKVCRHLVCWLACFAIVVVGVKMLENHVKDTPEWQEYMTYNKFRVSFWDYPHISYEDDPALFEEMGWTEEFYNMTQSMYFMDERFNKENLARFTERFSWFNFTNLAQMKTTLVETLSSLFRSERLVVLQAGVIGCFAVIVVTLLCSKKWRREAYPQLVSVLCCIGGTAFVLLFLGAKGRLPLRAWLACTIPCITLVTILLFAMATGKNRTGFGRKLTAAVLVGIWLFGMAWTYSKVINHDRAWRVDRQEKAMRMEAYVCAYPENVYVYDLMGAQNYSVFSIYPNPQVRPTNAFVWGSSYLFTPVHQEQLRLNGLESLNTEDLFRDNVYFIGYSSGAYSGQLYEMLCKEYGQVEMTPVDQIDNTFIVYQFSKVQE